MVPFEVVKVLLLGASGQLGRAIRGHYVRSALDEHCDLIPLVRQELDLMDSDSCRSIVQRYRPDWLINAAAYTSVDQAEAQQEQAELINAIAPGVLAQAVSRYGGKMLQLSTDFVFDGCQQTPYAPNDSTNPKNVYGMTKLRGEMKVLEALSCRSACILRTSWVYGSVGKNFLQTILRLHRERAHTSNPITVVSDQIGRPTSTAGLAEACWRVIERDVTGVHHWSDAGVASWFDFAEAITALASQAGVLTDVASVLPITTAEYPTAARRPAYSVLDTSTTEALLGLKPHHWRLALEHVLDELTV